MGLTPIILKFVNQFTAIKKVALKATHPKNNKSVKHGISYFLSMQGLNNAYSLGQIYSIDVFLMI